MLDGFDANSVIYLHALLTERHVGRAATRVGLSQSAMSRALSRLRQHFEDPLFVSTGRGLEPTPFAQHLQPSVSAAATDLQRLLEARAIFDPKTSRQRFRVLSADYSTTLLLGPLQVELCQAAPNVSLDIRDMSAAAGDGMSLPELDLVIGPPQQNRPSAVTSKLYTESFCVLVRVGHPATSGKWTLERYASQQHLLVAPGGQEGSVMGAVLKRAGLRRRVTVRVPSFLVVPDFLRETDLVATLPRRMAQYHAQRGSLRILDLPVESPAFDVTMSYPANRAHHPAHVWLRKRLVRVARSEP